MEYRVLIGRLSLNLSNRGQAAQMLDRRKNS
jgi:hypothetical protein